jgi:glutamate--cysteine ligase
MRGADGGSGAFIAALPAFWVGLMYDSLALDGAWQMVQDWTAAEREALRNAVPISALDARVGNRTVRDIAAELLELARAGLARRANRNGEGADETIYLAPIEEIVASGKTPADRLLDEYENGWHGDIDQIFSRHAY